MDYKDMAYARQELETMAAKVRRDREATPGRQAEPTPPDAASLSTHEILRNEDRWAAVSHVHIAARQLREDHANEAKAESAARHLRAALALLGDR